MKARAEKLKREVVDALETLTCAPIPLADYIEALEELHSDIETRLETSRADYERGVR